MSVRRRRVDAMASQSGAMIGGARAAVARHPRRRRHAVIAVVLAVCTLACAARIWLVNARAIVYPEVRHAMGEAVALDGAFNETVPPEDTRGYSVTVRSARVVSPNDFVREHGNDPAATREGWDKPSVVDLELEIANDGAAARSEESQQGGISIFDCVLEAMSGDYLICDGDLWKLAEPRLAETMGAFASVRSGTSYVTHIPYVHNGGSAEDRAVDPMAELRQAADIDRYVIPVPSGPLVLTLSGIPTRHVVDVYF